MNVLLNPEMPRTFQSVTRSSAAKKSALSFPASLLSLIILLSAGISQAQTIDESLFDCNVPEPLINGRRLQVSVVTGFMPENGIFNVQRWTGAYGLNTGSITSPGNATDANTGNAATMSYILSVSGGQRLTVQSNSGRIPAGYFAGFDIRTTTIINAALLGTLTLKTYLGNTLQERIDGGSGLLSVSAINASGLSRIGFVTTKPFDRIMIDQNQALGLALGATQIYYAVIRKFCPGPAPACNSNTRITENKYPVLVDGRNTGINTLACIQCSIANPGYAIDSIAGNYTQVILPAGVAATAAYAIADGATVYHSDSANPVFAGFDIENPTLIGADALSGLTVATTLNGVVQQSADMSSGLITANTSLLNGLGRQTVGFIPTGSFNGIKIIFNSAVKLNIGTTRIYSAILKSFCKKELPCNTLTAVQNPGYAVYVDGLKTGINAAGCVACKINNTENIVDGSTALPATVILGAGIGSRASVAVANAIETYPASSFAGFDIESASLLSGDLLASMNITLYNNGAAVQSGTAESLLAGASSSLITGGPNRQIVGIISRAPFDEVQLNIRNLAGADLGQIKIYKAYVQRACVLPIDCNFSRLLNSATDGAVIDAAHTGVKGGVCAGCLVHEPWNAVSEDTADYARLYNTAGGLVTNSLAVAFPAYNFPAGSFAGFSIRKNSFIVAAALFPSITITTYFKGEKQESRTGASLIDLTVLLQLLGSSRAVYIPGFYTSKPFDEIQITAGSLVTALDQYIDVYGAYADVRGHTAGMALNCNILNPDFNVTSVRVPVSGNTATNDKTQPGTVYGAAILPAGVTNPSSDLPSMNADGTYTFTATQPGVYQFEVPVCASAGSTNCPLVLLTITVLDNVQGKTNPPVANTDIAITKYDTPVTIHTLSNDRPGSPDLALNPSSVTITDQNGNTSGNTSSGGTATVDSATGDISYTPSAGFVGTDTIRYTVCDNQPVPQCATAYQIVTVLPPGAVNTTQAADDYYYTTSNTAGLTIDAAHGVLVNDTDPERDAIAAIAMDTVIAGKGRIQLKADGSFVFTPVAGFTGTVVIPYTMKDTGVPEADARASIYILIKPVVPDLTPVITVQPVSIHGTTNIAVVVDVHEINQIPASGLVTVYVVKSRLISLTFDSAATIINGMPVQNAKWTIDANSNSGYYILKTKELIPPGAMLSFGLTGVFTPGATSGKISVTTIITPKSGGEENSANNLDAEPIDFYEQ